MVNIPDHISSGDEHEVEAEFRSGAFYPRDRLNLPDGILTRLRIKPLPATPEADAEDEVAFTAFLRALALLGAFGLAAWAQSILLDAREWRWNAIVMAVVAVAVFATALRGLHFPLLRLEPPTEPRYTTTRLKITPLRAGLFLLSLVCMTIGLLWLATPDPDKNWVFVPWLASIICIIGAVVPLRREQLPATPHDPQRFAYAGAIAVVLLAALALRAWQVGAIPPTLSGDEGSQGREAMRVLSGAIQNPFGTGWLGVPTMSFYFNAPTIAILGPTATALRIPWAVVGTLTVLVTYLLMSRLAGRGFGLASAALLAGFHYHIHYSRLGSNQVADALFAGLALLFLFRGYDRRSPLFWTLSGLVLGASQFFYAGARFAAVLVAAVTLVFILRDGRRFWVEQRFGVAMLVAALLISGAPMIQYAIRFPDDYNARLNEVGIVQSGWLEREQEIRGQGALPILFDQFQRAVLAYNAYPDRTVWYGMPRPFFDLIPGTLFILGIGYAGVHLLNRRLFPLVAWWGGAILMGGMLTESPPSSQRIITTAVPATALVILAIILLAQGIWQAIGMRKQRVPAFILAAAILLLSYSGVRYYFEEYTPTRVYGNINAVVATELAHYANREVGTAGRLYFFGPPRMYVDFGTVPYLAPDVEGVSILEPITRPPGPELVTADKDAIFVFLPEREGELAYVIQAYPNGVYTQIPSPIDEIPLFSIYTVPRDSLVITSP